jgi:hypothetical protein
MFFLSFTPCQWFGSPIFHCTLLPVPNGQRVCSKKKKYSSSLLHVWVRGNPCRQYKMMMLIVTEEDGGSYPLLRSAECRQTRSTTPTAVIGVLSYRLILFFK